MNWFYTYRNFILGLCMAVTIAELGLDSRWTKATRELSYYFDFLGMGIYISALSFILLAVVLALPAFRKTKISYILPELAIILIMWAQWLAMAIMTIQQGKGFYPDGTCNAVMSDPIQLDACHKFFAIRALAIINFCLLLVYFLTLLSFAFVAKSKGNSIWFISVKEASQGSTNSDGMTLMESKA